MEKVIPPIKKVDKSDGLKLGSSHSTITTPNDIENKVGWKSKEESGTLFGKK